MMIKILLIILNILMIINLRWRDNEIRNEKNSTDPVIEFDYEELERETEIFNKNSDIELLNIAFRCLF
jgi:hypothetical protein